MNVLVTGGRGLLGRRVVAAAGQAGRRCLPGGLTCPDGERAGPTWEEWLAAGA